MKVLFIGCVEFSKLLLEEIIASKTVDVVGVVTKKKSKINSDFYDLSELSKLHQIDSFFYDVNQPKEEMGKWIQTKKPDIIFCFGWSHLIPVDIINYPRMGIIGYHPAELPKNRGRHPIIWALVLGLKKTASTFFMLDTGADSGDIVSQEIVEIFDSDEANTLYFKLNEVAKVQIVKICKELMNGVLTRVPQDHSQANVWRKRSDKDGVIDWRMSASVICNLVRGLTKPYPGAYFTTGTEEKISVWKAKKIKTETELSNIEPGKILSVDMNTFTVKTGDDVVQVTEYSGNFEPSVGAYL